jgi:hypothetical protein
MSETPAVDLDLAGTWASAGVYVFLGARPNSDKAFLAAFRSWQAISAPKNLRLLWLEDPNSSPDTWNPSSIRITKPNEQGGTIAAAARIALKNYVVVFERGCTLSLDGESPGFTLAAPEASTEKAYLTVERRRSLRGAPPCYPLPATGAELSLRGPAAGAIAFRLEIDAPSKANAPTCFDVLDVACRYFYPAADRSGAPVDSLSYPIFDGRASATALAAVLDPTAPLSDRTAFSIEPGDKPLATFFRTTVGGRIDLKPLADASLRFELRPDSSEDTGSFYLVPTGRFEIVLPEAAAGAEQLLCGVCAAEYVTLNPERTVLTFVPQQAAFAPLFEPSPTQPNDDAVEAPRLDFDAKTSWISLTAAEPLVYYAQPSMGGPMRDRRLKTKRCCRSFPCQPGDCLLDKRIKSRPTTLSRSSRTPVSTRAKPQRRWLSKRKCWHRNVANSFMNSQTESKHRCRPLTLSTRPRP